MKKEEDSQQNLSAGDFSSWLHQTRYAQKTKGIGAEVPCGECTACCRSSLFVHIKSEETETLKHIPKNLLFPAPGLPKGNVLMGYDQNGQCPMLINNRCSIYNFRPQTCRDFDCRIFSATGIEMDSGAQALIVERARRWRFAHTNELDKLESSALFATVTFLKEHKNLFPINFLPNNPTQLALLAIKVFNVFFKITQNTEAKEHILSDTDIAKAILRELDIFENEH